MSEEKKFYTIQEAIEIIGISEKELLRFIEEKKIPVLKVGRALRISKENIDNFLNDNQDYKGNNNDGYLEEDLEEVFSDNPREEMVDKEYQTVKNVHGSDLKIKHLQEEYKLLIEKKQELEEDINYLQIEYDEFRNKMKKLVVEEMKIFLKKIDNGKTDLEERFFKEL